MRILFSSQPKADHFAQPYISGLRSHGVVVDTLITTSRSEIEGKLLDGGPYDVLWLEWANHTNKALLSQGKFPTFTMVRIHDYEVRTRLVDAFPWGNVDLAWFINPDSKRDCGELPCRTILLNNAIDLAQFEYQPTLFKPRHTLLMQSCYAQSRKRYDRAFELLSLLPEYRLRIRVDFLNAAEEQAFMLGADRAGVANRVVHEWRSARHIDFNRKDDVNAFYQKGRFVLSTSEHEAFHYAIAEGIACGCIPVVYNWEWGYAEYFWSPFVYRTLEAMAKFIRDMSAYWNWKGQSGYKGGAISQWPLKVDPYPYLQRNFSAYELARQLLIYLS